VNIISVQSNSYALIKLVRIGLEEIVKIALNTTRYVKNMYY
jgi:hypothetical protein